MLPSIQFIPCCRSAGRYRWMDFIEKVRINKSTTMADLELRNQRFSRGTFSFHYISFWDCVLNVYSDVGVMMTHRLLVFVLDPSQTLGRLYLFQRHWIPLFIFFAWDPPSGVTLTSVWLPACCYAFCYYKMGIVTAKGPSTIDHHLLV